MPADVAPIHAQSIPDWPPGEHRELGDGEDEELFMSIHRFGFGTVGYVEAVVSTAPPCPVFACKRILLTSKRAERIARAQNVIRALKSLRHRHIIALMATYKTEREFSILMSPVGDRNLETFLIDFGSREPEQIQEHKTWLHGWFACLASALRYIHSNGFLHQDIKLSNIIHRGREVYFTDFCSAPVSEPIHVGSNAHHPGTMNVAQGTWPHERCKRSPLGQTRRKDIFALGCVYLEMLAVLDGRSVLDFRAYCNHPTGDYTGSQYARAMRRTKTWFAYRCFDDPAYCDCWGRTILPMLAEEETARPEATEVLRKLLTKDLLPSSSRFCACHFNDAAAAIADDKHTETRKSNVFPTDMATADGLVNAMEFFKVKNNTTADFQVELVHPPRCGPWQNLTAASFVTFKGHTYPVGSIVWIKTDRSAESNSMAEIAEVRHVGDGTQRVLIRVFWFYERQHVVRRLRATQKKTFPDRYRYAKTTHMDVFLWDCIQAAITEEELAMILPGRVAVWWSKSLRLYHMNSPVARWTNVCM